MKIGLVIPSLQAGGMERVMSELADYFSRKDDVEVHLVLYGITRQMFFSVPDNVIVHKPSFEFNNRWRFLYTIKTILFLRNKIKQINPYSILSFGEYWNNFVLLSLLGVKIKTYVSDRSQPDKSLGKFHDRLRHWLYPKATGLVLQTQKARNIFQKRTQHSNIAVIGNPIREIVSNGKLAEKEKVVLMVGRLIKSKNQDLLIRIFANVHAPEWKLMIVGYDHLKQENMERLKNLAKELGVYDRVVFTGKHDNPDELYNQSSIFAFTSSSEGFPNVIGEAMSASLPVVSFDCVAGPSDLIQEGENGFLVPLFDLKAFEEKLSLLIENSELRTKMGNNAKQSIQRFSKDKVCEAFFEFITA